MKQFTHFPLINEQNVESLLVDPIGYNKNVRSARNAKPWVPDRPVDAAQRLQVLQRVVFVGAVGVPINLIIYEIVTNLAMTNEADKCFAEHVIDIYTLEFKLRFVHIVVEIVFFTNMIAEICE